LRYHVVSQRYAPRKILEMFALSLETECIQMTSETLEG